MTNRRISQSTDHQLHMTCRSRHLLHSVMHFVILINAIEYTHFKIHDNMCIGNNIHIVYLFCHLYMLFGGPTFWSWTYQPWPCPSGQFDHGNIQGGHFGLLAILYKQKTTKIIRFYLHDLFITLQMLGWHTLHTTLDNLVTRFSYMLLSVHESI